MSERKRQPNVRGGRSKLCEVWTSPEQTAVILQAAARDGVVPARFVAEAAMAVARAEDAAGVLETPTQRRAQLAELFALRHEIAAAAVEARRVGNNVNQVAKGVHLGQPVPVEEMRGYLSAEQRFLADTRATVARLDELIDAIAEQGVDA